ncbi:hypothetical protein AKJ16_DCAP05035 [Drosera capensis]
MGRKLRLTKKERETVAVTLGEGSSKDEAANRKLVAKLLSTRSINRCPASIGGVPLGYLTSEVAGVIRGRVGRVLEVDTDDMGEVKGDRLRVKSVGLFGGAGMEGRPITRSSRGIPIRGQASTARRQNSGFLRVKEAFGPSDPPANHGWEKECLSRTEEDDESPINVNSNLTRKAEENKKSAGSRDIDVEILSQVGEQLQNSNDLRLETSNEKSQTGPEKPLPRGEDRQQEVANNAKKLGSPKLLIIAVSNVDDCKLMIDATINHFGRGKGKNHSNFILLWLVSRVDKDRDGGVAR